MGLCASLTVIIVVLAVFVATCMTACIKFSSAATAILYFLYLRLSCVRMPFLLHVGQPYVKLPSLWAWILLILFDLM